jgi:hypothetical protein
MIYYFLARLRRAHEEFEASVGMIEGEASNKST